MREFDLNMIKILRHTTNRKEMKAIVANDNFELYQSYQKLDIFNNTSYIISFIAQQGTTALLYGVYKVNKKKTVTKLPKELEEISIAEKWGAGPYFSYELIRVDHLKDLENRLIIDWGGATVQWHQRKLDKEIIQILP